MDLQIAKYKDPRDACAAIVAESYRLWLQYETRTDDITIILVHINGLTDVWIYLLSFLVYFLRSGLFDYLNILHLSPDGVHPYRSEGIFTTITASSRTGGL
jgi:hypothetical protein